MALLPVLFPLSAVSAAIVVAHSWLAAAAIYSRKVNPIVLA
jgi:hypothetical protein